MPPLPALPASSSAMARTTKAGFPIQTIATIVFGLCAVMGTMFTLWQGHKSLKLRSQQKAEASSATNEIELHSPSEPEPQRSHLTVFPPLPDVSKKTLPCLPDVSKKSLPRLPDRPKKSFPRLPDIPRKSYSRLPDIRRKSYSRLPDSPKKASSRLPDSPKKASSRLPDSPKKASSRLPDAPKRTINVTVTSIPPKEVFESLETCSTPILVPPGVKIKSHRVLDTKRATPYRGRINRPGPDLIHSP